MATMDGKHMAKDKALDLALEGAANYIDALGGDSRKYRQALANAALDRMAENARELGLDYEPVAPVQEDWGPGPHECHSLTAAQRQSARSAWVGLTDEEVRETISSVHIEPLFSYRHVAQAIEAKLKEKNSD